VPVFPAMAKLPPPLREVGVPMGTFRGLPREVLGTVGLEPEGDDDEPDGRTGRTSCRT
jgi:hypothetical protein